MRRSAEFAAAIRGGRRASVGALTVHLAAGPDPTGTDSLPQPARIGLVVSRAVGPAVVRNRVRRRLRHLLRTRLDLVPAGSAAVVRAAPAAASLSSAALAAQLDSALARLRAGRRT